MNVSPMSNVGTAPNMGVSPMSNAGMQPKPNMGVSPMAGMSAAPKAGVSPTVRQGTMPDMGGTTATMPSQGLALRPPTAASSAGMETPTTVESPYYTAGFLRNFIGQNMRVEFLIGTSGALVDRVGVLVEVGASYIVLRPYLTDDLLMCDLYSIKFVTIYG
ncbi:MAG: hypothetical protein GXW96_08505 [Christensenellaceae bacterium]|nr:hypothetical protein [Christensenellaceae bacterium]